MSNQGLSKKGHWCVIKEAQRSQDTTVRNKAGYGETGQANVVGCSILDHVEDFSLYP